MQVRFQRVAVVGSGPAGATLAGLLARAGRDVTLYTTGKRPPLLVGESLVPAIVPVIRELGIEDEVKSYSMWKPGATFYPVPGEELDYPFANIKSALPPYAYNLPRNRFDQSVEDAAVRLGAKRVTQKVSYVAGPSPGSVRLSTEEGELDFDLIVDATGRSRMLAKFLDLPSEAGDRQDVALFAHHENVPAPRTGHIHIDRLTHGWAWRIPLPDRVSVGIVVHGDYIKEFGAGAEEQYDNFLKQEPSLSVYTSRATRVTPVAKYNNYQMVTRKLVGPGWALVGDSAGFIDPIFSSGLYLAMDGASHLAEAILDGSDRRMAEYEAYQLDHIEAWQRIVRHYYSGRILTLLRYGKAMAGHPVGSMVQRHVQKHMGRLFTGAAGKSLYSRRLLDFMATRGIAHLNHRQLQIN